MRSVRQGMLAFTAAAALSIPGIACDNTARGAREDVAEAQRSAAEKTADAREEAREEVREAREDARDAAADAREDARDAAKETRDDARDMSRDAGDRMKDAGEDMKDAGKSIGAAARDMGKSASRDASRTASEGASKMGAAGETMDVKSALMADDSVDSSGINVDTYAETRTVVLRGTVPTAAQKTAAGKIAQREAEGYKVDNKLVVSAARR